MSAAMNFYTKLINRGVLQLVGADTRTFLQGQTTCDVDTLSQDQSINGAYCTPQGRMVCDFRAVALNETDCLLSMNSSICDNSAAVFGKYIVFSKSEISNASDDWVVFALWGDDLTATKVGIDELGNLWSQVDDSGTRFECHCPAALATKFETRLAEIASEATEAEWQLQEINAGLGHIEADTVEMFIPQMLNYQATGQLNFSKGCYTGQEVVARMHYRGKLKRPMYIADIEAAAPLAGTALFKAGSDQSVGNIVNAVTTSGGSRVLAVCTTDSVEAGVILGHQAGPALSFIPLPYSLESLL
jgi:folate-binding protein YgfZ